MCIITSLLKLFREPVTTFTRGTYLIFETQLLVLGYVKNENKVFACVNGFRVFVSEQMITLVPNRPP